MPYPLQPLLSVRAFRENKANAVLQAAQAALLEARAQLEDRRAELERYALWLPEEKERRYADIMGQSLSLTDLENFKAGLAHLEAGVFEREEEVLKAEKTVADHEILVQEALSVLRSATKEKLKIESHKDIWDEEWAREAQRAADLELEDVSPGTTLHQPGYAQED